MQVASGKFFLFPDEQDAIFGIIDVTDDHVMCWKITPKEQDKDIVFSTLCVQMYGKEIMLNQSEKAILRDAVVAALQCHETRRRVENCFGGVNQERLEAIFVKYGITKRHD